MAKWVIITECEIINAILYLYFFFNDTATTEIYTLSLHDALPISVAMNISYKDAALFLHYAKMLG